MRATLSNSSVMFGRIECVLYDRNASDKGNLTERGDVVTFQRSIP